MVDEFDAECRSPGGKRIESAENDGEWDKASNEIVVLENVDAPNLFIDKEDLVL